MEVANRNTSSRISFFEVLVSAPARAPRRARFDFLRCTSSTACSFAINTTGPDGSAQIRKFSYIRYITGKKSTSMARCLHVSRHRQKKSLKKLRTKACTVLSRFRKTNASLRIT